MTFLLSKHYKTFAFVVQVNTTYFIFSLFKGIFYRKIKRLTFGENRGEVEPTINPFPTMEKGKQLKKHGD
jgi:hypothetical protein